MDSSSTPGPLPMISLTAFYILTLNHEYDYKYLYVNNKTTYNTSYMVFWSSCISDVTPNDRRLNGISHTLIQILMFFACLR